jgi:outer membrane protein
MRIKIKKYLMLLAMGAIVLGAQAQSEPKTFSLEESLQFAMENSYILKNTSNDVAIAKQKVWETITIGLPQVSGSANYNAFLNLPTSLLPGEIIGKPGEYIPVKFGQDYNSDFGVNISQLLFDGSYIVGVSSTQIYMRLSEQAHAKTQIDIREAVTQAYYVALVGVEYKKAMEDNLKNVQRLYDETKIFYENGFREEQDVDQIKLLMKTAENDVLAAEREITISKVVLKYAMGFDLDLEISLSDNLFTFLAPLENKENTFNFDFNTHIDYQLATTNFQISEKLMKLEKAEYLPRLSGFYNFTKSAYGNNANLFSSSNEWYPSSLVGFQLTMSIFNSGQKKSKVKQAKIELDKADIERKLIELTLQKDYLTAITQLETANESFLNDKENRILAEKILTKTKIKFDNGISTSTELSQIQTQYIDSYRALVTSILQLLQADIQLKKVTGSL